MGEMQREKTQKRKNAKIRIDGDDCSRIHPVTAIGHVNLSSKKMHPLIKPSFALVLCGSRRRMRAGLAVRPALFLRAAPHTLHACTPHNLHVPRPQSSAHSPSDVAFSGRACSAQATVIRRTSAPALRWSTCDNWRQLRRFAALCLPCTAILLAITRTHIALVDSSFGVGAQKPLARVLRDSERLSTSST